MKIEDLDGIAVGCDRGLRCRVWVSHKGVAEVEQCDPVVNVVGLPDAMTAEQLIALADELRALVESVS